MSIFRKEPALIVSAIEAIIALAATFGLGLSPEQTGAIMAVVVIIAGVITRQSVYSPATVEEIKADNA